MISLALLAILAADGGTSTDAPWVEHRVSGKVVCMTEETAVKVAAGVVFTETAHEKEHAVLVKSDPSPVKIIIAVAAGALAGAALTVAVGCGTGHCR